MHAETCLRNYIWSRFKKKSTIKKDKRAKSEGNNRWKKARHTKRIDYLIFSDVREGKERRKRRKKEGK